MPRNFTMIFYGPKGRSWALVAPGGVPRRGQPTSARQEAQACPGGLCPPRGTPQVLLWPIGCFLVHKKSIKSFAAFGLRLILIFYEVINKQKQQLALGTGSIG